MTDTNDDLIEYEERWSKYHHPDTNDLVYFVRDGSLPESKLPDGTPISRLEWIAWPDKDGQQDFREAVEGSVTYIIYAH